MPEADAPAPTSPDAEPQVEIGLGPDASIYPEHLRAPAAPPAETAPESAEASAPEDEPAVAGAAESPQEGETRGARRRIADEAYQRGVAETRAAIEREQQQRTQQQQWETTQREATQRVEQLFEGLNSSDYATQERARQGILQMYHGNRQAQALMTTTRQQILQEMAADFGKLKDLEGMSEADYQEMFSAPSAADLAKRAMAIGAKSKDEQIAKLEAELQGLRGRLVGSRATPEAYNGAAGNADNISIETYQAMSPKDARKLTPAQIDALTAQMAADASRNGHS